MLLNISFLVLVALAYKLIVFSGTVALDGFFFITLIALVDVVVGSSVTIRTARRDFAVGPDSGAI